jgi:hypothetical protein
MQTFSMRRSSVKKAEEIIKESCREELLKTLEVRKKYMKAPLHPRQDVSYHSYAAAH